MVKFFLKVRATLDNVALLEPVDTPESPYEYVFRITCTKCRTQNEKPVLINRFESHEMSGSRGEASFVFRCKECKNEHSASIARTKNSVQESNAWTPLLEIDARGLDFDEFIPQGRFQAIGSLSKTKFDQVDLEDAEWYDYDEKDAVEVSIVDVEWDITR